jgi:hypothetical protein
MSFTVRMLIMSILPRTIEKSISIESAMAPSRQSK